MSPLEGRAWIAAGAEFDSKVSAGPWKIEPHWPTSRPASAAPVYRVFREREGTIDEWMRGPSGRITSFRSEVAAQDAINHRKQSDHACGLTPPAICARPAAAPTGAGDAAMGNMTAERAAFFLHRFKLEEKMLGPNEQAALEFAIAALAAPQQPADHFVDADKMVEALKWSAAALQSVVPPEAQAGRVLMLGSQKTVGEILNMADAALGAAPAGASTTGLAENALPADHGLAKGKCLHGVSMAEHCGSCEAKTEARAAAQKQGGEA